MVESPAFLTNKQPWLLCALVLLVLLPACAPSHDTLTGKAFEGRVLEQSTGQPIADAIVVALWIGDLPGIADSRTVCYHVLSTTADAEGHFRFAAWEKQAVDWQRKVKPEYVRLTAYRRDYEFAETTADKRVYLRKFSGTQGERLRYLLQLASWASCHGAGDERPAFPFYKSLYDEAKRLASTEEDRDTLMRLRRWAALAWVHTERSLTDREVESLIQSNENLREQLR